jgi:hypothetical protein
MFTTQDWREVGNTSFLYGNNFNRDKDLGIVMK